MSTLGRNVPIVECLLLWRLLTQSGRETTAVAHSLGSTTMIRQLGILMGLFSGFFGGEASADQFHTKEQFKENVVRQTTLTPQTLSQLYEYGVTEDTKLKLEYFFYTNSEGKAAALHNALVELGYTGEYGQSASDDSIFVVSGWTTPVTMAKDSALTWTKSMCKLGFQHDAEFDGWGTNPNQ